MTKEGLIDILLEAGLSREEAERTAAIGARWIGKFTDEQVIISCLFFHASNVINSRKIRLY
ncbi:hypothetical protein KTO58_08845 [Chitinophaga pendula]|uniref:hypothetical protein n=1 Tax=Chitinophaga TaxID=79328 RepID=UPI000BAF31B6|nr:MULTISPECIES: hypothetical protein [Chitinophaga]ASZ13103.1 hypothetical protein CK934_20130 [Chitinophaga sp. MD30]UCJ09275.1 hypothetical protein KTO58_08845 [Chitinophaga pendula]